MPTRPYSRDDILDAIASGRTDFVFDLLALPGWREAIAEEDVSPLSWFVYFGDVTAMKAVLAAGGDLETIDLDEELGAAAFGGHWKMCDFLILQGANANAADARTGETPLMSALSKAGRPAYFPVVRLLLERGADVHARTIPDVETGAFMRDVRTRGETALHRAAAFANLETIRLLIDRGADLSARDAYGDTPLSWASWHLRPGAILHLLQHGEYEVSEAVIAKITTDHGDGWGYGMEKNMLGDFVVESESPKTSRLSDS